MDRGRPTALLVSQSFQSLARMLMKARGYPDAPFVVIPHPFESLPEETIRRIAREKVTEIIAAVSEQPLPRA